MLGLSITLFAVVELAVLFFLVIPLAIGKAGGWAALGKEYRIEGRFEGNRWWFQDVTLRGWCTYSGCVSVGANADGIYLNTVFWLCHPALFIPWADLQASRRESNFLGMRFGFVDFVSQRVPGVKITLRESVLQKIAAARSLAQTESDDPYQSPTWSPPPEVRE